jgi:hypothetical protein
MKKMLNEGNQIHIFTYMIYPVPLVKKLRFLRFRFHNAGSGFVTYVISTVKNFTRKFVSSVFFQAVKFFGGDKPKEHSEDSRVRFVSCEPQDSAASDAAGLHPKPSPHVDEVFEPVEVLTKDKDEVQNTAPADEKQQQQSESMQNGDENGGVSSGENGGGQSSGSDTEFTSAEQSSVPSGLSAPAVPLQTADSHVTLLEELWLKLGATAKVRL